MHSVINATCHIDSVLFFLLMSFLNQTVIKTAGMAVADDCGLVTAADHVCGCVVAEARETMTNYVSIITR